MGREANEESRCPGFETVAQVGHQGWTLWLETRKRSAMGEFLYFAITFATFHGTRGALTLALPS